MGGAYSTNGEKKNSYETLVIEPEGKRLLGKPRCIWVNNIKTGLTQTEWCCKDWIDLARDRDQWRAVVCTALKLRVS
jgi:hypothetical protein